MTKVKKDISGRLFVVGSARSGSTLLQAMLARNSKVYTFPESHFFCRTIRDGRRKRWFGVANVSGAKASLRDLTKLVGRDDLMRLGPRWDPRIRTYTTAFTNIVDIAAIEHNKPVWLEKTPHHIDHLKDISKFVPNAKFIHILRDGRDVVASQYSAQQQDPEYWRPWPIEQMARSWGRDVSISLKQLKNESHFFVSYSALIVEPERVLREICSFADLEFEPEMLRHWEAADTVLGGRSSEPWMQQVYEPVRDTRLVKFNSLFTSDQQKSVISNLLFEGNVDAVLASESRDLSS